jgi:hypothetical protein
MATMQVWHAKQPTFGMGPTPAWPDDYELVAEVECDTPGEAFRLTNHIDRAWWKNPGVQVVGEPRHRSTSVGDVVEIVDGDVLRVAGLGWEPVQEQPRVQQDGEILYRCSGKSCPGLPWRASERPHPSTCVEGR